MVDNSLRPNYPALVIKINDEYNLVINRGSEHGVTEGNQFLVYATESEEIFDPETGESLGYLEIVKGTGVAVHVQRKMTTIKSTNFRSSGRIIRRQTGVFSHFGEEIEEPKKTILPFDYPEVGDNVKLISS